MTARLTLTIHGMGCEGCVAAVNEAVERVPGVQKVRVDLARGRAEVEGDPGLDANAVRDAVEAAGYEVRAVQSGTPSTA
ncbi:MAG TPA: heavy metal-associated domain-containing protein [Geminicoccaceae bacterium]|nr:heavy metal-associated domain-containing protein [Geminicoccaceae bacterium]